LILPSSDKYNPNISWVVHLPLASLYWRAKKKL